MAEFVNVLAQNVLEGANVLYASTPIRGGRCIQHRDGSGLVKLSGLTYNCFARFKISFGANITVPTGGTAGEISVAIAVDGEQLGETLMMATPTDIGDFFNVHASTFVDVPKGGTATVSVENTSSQAITVQNANLIVERVA